MCAVHSVIANACWVEAKIEELVDARMLRVEGIRNLLEH